mgnify:CR=1 FL=1
MFIILTGENWNEVMILVIDNSKSFTPAYLFISMMLLGNFMLLNLFLAILLKSISDIGDADDDGECQMDDVAEMGNDEPREARKGPWSVQSHGKPTCRSRLGSRALYRFCSFEFD